jgi:glucuronokinase
MTVSASGVAFARAGLLGNPSDGYGGKAIACSVRNFAARAVIEPNDAFAIEVGDDRLDLADIGAALDPTAPIFGHGLSRLTLAAFRRYMRCLAPGADPDTPFTISCTTDIPRQVGLAGSSAVIIATMRALAVHFDSVIPPFDLAEQALATEVEDLDIAAGPMDRVIQTYEGVMEMDLAPPRSEASYRRVSSELIPPMLIAWDPGGGRSSGEAHSDLRERWRRGDRRVLDTIEALRHIVEQGMLALEARDRPTFVNLVNFNFDLRCRVFPVGERDRQMVDIARRIGGGGKLCGSGGATLVVHPDDAGLSAAEQALVAAGFRCCRPRIS